MACWVWVELSPPVGIYATESFGSVREKKRADWNRPAGKIRVCESALVHAAHAAARTSGTAGCRALLVVFLQFGDERFGGEHQARDGSCVLQRQAGDLGGIN